MLSSYINSIQHIVADKEQTTPTTTHQLFECIRRNRTGEALPWLDDNAILLFAGYVLMTQGLVKGLRLADKIAVIDSQITKGLINVYERNQNVMDRSERATAELRRIYRDHAVILQPVSLDDHWFLITYADNTFRVFDSLRSGVSEIVMAELDVAIFGPNSMKRREFSSPFALQKSYWECGYFVCSIIRDIISSYNEDTHQVSYPSDRDTLGYALHIQCHEIAKEMLNAYCSFQRFFLQ